MAFKEVTALDADVTISLGGTNKKTGKANPKVAEGYLLGKKEVADTKKKSGVSYLYILQTPKGNLGVWGKTDLDKKMPAVPLGSMVRITQSGMAQTPNGEMYKFKVEVDSTNTVDVSSVEAAAQDNDIDDSFESTSYDDGASEEDQEDQIQAAALAALERKKKVEAMLGKKTAKN